MATYAASNKSLGNSMGFYNAEQEQAPILKQLADRFTLGDNFHQSFHGGTGANHFMLGTGDAAFWSDGKGNPTTPPASLIANPNPVSGTSISTRSMATSAPAPTCSRPASDRS